MGGGLQMDNGRQLDGDSQIVNGIQLDNGLQSGGGMHSDNDSQSDHGLNLDNGMQSDDGSQLDGGMQSGGDWHLGGVFQLGAHTGAPLRGRTTINERGNPNDNEWTHTDNEKYGLHNKKYNAAINNLVDWFKTMTTNEYIRGVKQYGWKRFDGKLWQRNYYEHIIRSTEEYERIADYITDNPAKWKDDKFFK
jgi:hypothetical protein